MEHIRARCALLAILTGFTCGTFEVSMSTSKCGDVELDVTEVAGALQTGNFPAHYPPNCRWRVVIRLPSGGLANVKFIGFGLALGDFLMIQDAVINFNRTWAADSTSPLNDTYQLNSGFSVTFTSDNASENVGFRLDWTAIIPEEQTTTVTSTTSAGRTTINLPEDTVRLDVEPDKVSYVQSPGYPANYPSSTNSHWILQAPANTRIKMEFMYFKTQKSFDFLRIYSGQDLNSEQIIGEYTGDYPPMALPSPLLSITNRVHLVFTSDPTINFPGFIIKAQIDQQTTLTTLQSVAKTSNPAVTSVSVILAVLFVTSIVSAVIYYAWYRPKKRAEERVAAKYKNNGTDDGEDGKYIQSALDRSLTNVNYSVLDSSFSSNGSSINWTGSVTQDTVVESSDSVLWAKQPSST